MTRLGLTFSLTMEWIDPTAMFVRGRSSILASKLASIQIKREPRTLKSWAHEVEMGESRTPCLLFITGHQRPRTPNLREFLHRRRSSSFTVVRRRCCQNCCQDALLRTVVASVSAHQPRSL